MKTQEEIPEITINKVDKKTWIEPTMEILEIEKNFTIDLHATVAS